MDGLREFLPAVLELQHSPPRPAGRWVLRCVVALVAVGLLWACVGRIDVVAVATGQIVPAGRSKSVQASEGGSVREVRVQEGQQVRAGDVLLRLDTAEHAAELARVEVELHAERLALAGNRARNEILAIADAEPAALTRSLDVCFGEVGVRPDAAERALQLRLLQARHHEYLGRLAMLSRRDAARRAERRSAQALEHKLARSLPLLAQRADSALQLARRGLVSRDDVLGRDLERANAEQDMAAARERGLALAEESASLEAERAALAEGERRAVLAAIEAQVRNTQSLARETQRVRERLARAELRAPADGIVQQLTVRSAGAVVRSAETLMVVVPQDAPLEVEAWVLDRDIGFVRGGQSAAVKVDAFDFTRFGLLEARVGTLSTQAIEHQRLGPVYAARIALARAFFPLERGRAELAPGMAVQVEIRTGRRRIIEYFLSPFARAARDSLKER